MKGLIAAIQFITILPAGKRNVYDPVGMIPFFPVVGLLLGAMVALVDAAAVILWSKTVAAVIDVLLLAGLTGALHLDGLGDAADGLFGHRPKEKALEIMKDSRIGVMALVAIVGCLALKWGGIGGLESHRALLLVLVPAYARSGMIFGVRHLPYGRPDGGTGHGLFERSLPRTAFGTLLIPFGLSVLLGWTGLWLNIGFVAITAILIAYYRRRIGCITGDMLGAMVETTEAVLFLLVASGGVS